jgi:HAMP domain-containing protein
MTKAAPPSSQPEDERLKELANALADMRDSWVNLSLMLKDLATELPTPRRDEVAMEVERYLARLREAGRRGFD